MGDDIDPTKIEHQLATLRSENAGLTTQVQERDASIETLNGTVDRLTWDVALQGSSFIGEKVNPALRDPELFRMAYAKHLERDDSGNIVVKDGHGNTVMSEKNAGQPASLDEALPKIVTNPIHLAAGNASGGGEGGGKTATATTSTNGSGSWKEMDARTLSAAVKEHGSLEAVQKAHP